MCIVAGLRAADDDARKRVASFGGRDDGRTVAFAGYRTIEDRQVSDHGVFGCDISKSRERRLQQANSSLIQYF